RRLLLARALATRARVLLLDEPGEHLDPRTADHVIADLLRAGGQAPDDPYAPTDGGARAVGRTERRGVVLVTHRLAPLRAADEVVLLGVPGRELDLRVRDAPPGGTATVLARGTHADLLATVPAYRWAAEQEVG